MALSRPTTLLLSQPQDIELCVMIAAQADAAVRAGAPPDRQAVLHEDAAAAPPLAGLGRRHSYRRFPALAASKERMVRNALQPSFARALASWWFRTMLTVRTPSQAILS
jgi:hypothetical protein